MRGKRPSSGPVPADFPPTADAPAAERLAWLFHHNGYLRRQNVTRRKTEGWRAYKKGDEIRLTAQSRSELAEVRQLLLSAEFFPGRPFRKGKKWYQPLYGRVAVARFLAMIDAAGPADA